MERLKRLCKGHNSEYWQTKIRGNVRRDRRVNRALAREGWRVLRLWESDIRRDPEQAADQVVRVLLQRLGE
jgi:DNA mismatch endonuclease (patch repair protein)